MKAISYSLFGAGKEKEPNCFSFESYLSSVMLSVRFNKLLYKDWETIIHVDAETFSQYEDLLNILNDRKILKVSVIPGKYKLCEAMLWRLYPIWSKTNKGEHEYSHIICRDLDSLSTYREVQAVQTWLNNGKAMHAITDSTSHNIPLMGGMIGFNVGAWWDITDIRSFEQLLSKTDIDFSRKGSDQTFLNKVVYPYFSKPGEDSITQHYFKGMPNTWLSDYHTCNCWLYSWAHGHKEGCPEDIDINLPEELKQTNEISEHMGAAGFNHQQTMRLLDKYSENFTELLNIEKGYPDLFFWVK